MGSRLSCSSRPDRLDALVWALSELMLVRPDGWGLMEFYRRQETKPHAS